MKLKAFYSSCFHGKNSFGDGGSHRFVYQPKL